jgi:DNA-binding LytR/AlgR family response regulator
MLKCIALDDEPLALSLIESYCQRLDDISLQAFTDPHAAMAAVRRDHPDVVFLDIQLGDESGMSLAHQLPDDICVVFTTAYGGYALEDYEVNAVDYLQKPFFFSRFRAAIEKARRWREMRLSWESARHDDRLLTLKSEYRNVVVSLDSILYVEALDNYVKIYLQGHRSVLSQMSMKAPEEMLPAEDFLRVHRSFVISLDKVVDYTRRWVRLRGVTATIPVGRSYSSEFAKRMERRSST